MFGETHLKLLQMAFVSPSSLVQQILFQMSTSPKFLDTHQVQLYLMMPVPK